MIIPPQVFENKKRNHLVLSILVSAYSSCVLNRVFLSRQTNKKYVSFVHCNSEFTPLDSAGSLSTTYQLPTEGAKNHTPNSHVLTFCTIWTCSYICLSMFHPANMGHSWSFNSSWIKRRMWKLEVGWGYSLHYPGASINLSGFPFHHSITIQH